jgi:signal transduction histidine kinase
MRWPDEYPNNAIALLGSIPLLIVLVLFTWQHRKSPVGVPILGLLFARSFWVVFRLLEIFSVSPDAKLFWFRLTQAILPIVAALGIVILIQFIRPKNLFERKFIFIIIIPTLLMTLTIITNPMHGWNWQMLWIDEIVHGQRTAVTWIYVLYFFLLFFFAAFLQIRFAIRWPIFRWPVSILLFSVIASYSGDIITNAFMLSRKTLDPTIIIFIINITIFVLVGVGQRRMLDVLPIAREIAIDRMTDGIAVLNDQGKLVFQNPAARSLLLHPWAVIGTGQTASLPALAESAAAHPVEIQAEIAGEQKLFTVQSTHLEDPRGMSQGNLLIFHDDTLRLKNRQILIHQQRTMAVLEERERIAAELHDDLGQVLGFVKMQAQAARYNAARGDLSNLDQSLAQLINVTQNAHIDVREFILGAKTSALLEQGLSCALEEYFEQFNQNFNMSVHLQILPGWDDDRIEPAATIQLMRIVQEAVTNARKHANVKTAFVTLDANENHAEVTIQDDGQGYEPAEQDGEQGISFGIGFMRRRAEGIGASLIVQSSPGFGTKVIVRFPKGRNLQ